MKLPALSLYIHLPWCERKCPYCDFNSHETEQIPEAEYVTALLRDLEADLPLVQDRRIETLFIGGGTPSLFSVAAIESLMRGLGERLDLNPAMEATLEANPGSAEAEKFQGFYEAGINRLSLGIQSFQDDKLQALGRVHSSEQALAAVDHARSAGFENFNLDLMHGLPGQTMEDARFDLDTALSFSPPHLSWYQLTIEPNTVFNKRPPLLPVEDELADIQDAGENVLQRAGLMQYEVSAYSRSNHQCRHNLNYWSFGDYLAIGAGAHGKITVPDGRIQRFSKSRKPGDYLADPQSVTTNRRYLDEDEAISEFMLFALRLNAGFSEESFTAHTGQPISSAEPRLNSLVERGLLEREEGKVRASALGRRFLDSVIAEFLPTADS